MGKFDHVDSKASPLFSFQAASFSIEGVAHPPIQTPPQSLGELQVQLELVGSSLFPALTEWIRSQAREGVIPQKDDKRKRIILLLRVPRLYEGSQVRVDVQGFLIDADLGALGLALGILQRTTPEGPAFAFGPVGANQVTVHGDAWKGIELTPMDIRHGISRADARAWSGIPQDAGDFHGVLAGVGALGSALAELWARSGWGRWDFVDPDRVEPHNVIRHLARHGDIGRSKVDVVRAWTSHTLGESDTDAQALQLKANAVGEQALDVIMDRAQLLVDTSTTLAVPRDWSTREVARAASAFLTPSGLSSVLLLEDAARSVRVASLEAQYYRAILRQPWGEAHLFNDATLRRTGAGCRDRSLVMAAEQIQLHAALLARRLRFQAARADAAIGVWSVDDESGAVAFYDVPVYRTQHVVRGAWAIYWDEGLYKDLCALRSKALPHETGGILLGVTDHKLKTIHLVDALAAPADSQSSPDGFTRGKQDVDQTRLAACRRTADMVNYVGEWHSHPPGVSARPSTLDVELLARLTLALSADGLPGVMLIVGETELNLSLGQSSSSP